VSINSDIHHHLALLITESGMLKRARRSGWWICGVRDPESVAEHSWRAALIASLIAMLEGADSSRAALLAAWHDFPESRVSDLSRVSRFYTKTTDPHVVIDDQTRGLPPSIRDAIAGIIEEFEANQTLEAMCARDADKLECLAQAEEYIQQGFDGAQDWVTHCRSRLQTASAKELAASISATSTTAWYRTFVDAKLRPGQARS
jgi:5'-deoxynucleotidase YfbR-like HD superfamily hydrolase